MFRSSQLRRGCSRAFALAAIVGYASVALVGYGLHDLVGVHHCHDAAALHPAGGHPSDGACCSHAGHGHPRSSEPAPSNAGSSIGASCDDCTICGLLAQAQSHAILAAPLAAAVPFAEAPDLAEALVLSLRAEASLARGPPTV